MVVVVVVDSGGGGGGVGGGSSGGRGGGLLIPQNTNHNIWTDPPISSMATQFMSPDVQCCMNRKK